jgi:hypothetical protein
MNGPQHYREAERIMTELTLIQDGKTQEVGFPEAMALAQVHATLALAAAVAVKTTAAEDAWAEAAGTRSSGRFHGSGA